MEFLGEADAAGYRHVAAARSGERMQRARGQDERAADRENMVIHQLARRDIHSERVLDAMRRIPREWFVPPKLSSKAYADSALPIERSQTISQPYIVAKMTDLLDAGPRASILEIGTGSGYQTAILALLAGRVYTIEWHLSLMTQAARRLERLGVENVMYRCTDGSLGWPERAPFNGIIVTAGAPDVPAPLSNQLAVGGRLVLPVGPKDDQTLVLIRRTRGGFEREDIFKCRFVKLHGEAGWRE